MRKFIATALLFVTGVSLFSVVPAEAFHKRGSPPRRGNVRPNLATPVILRQLGIVNARPLPAGGGVVVGGVILGSPADLAGIDAGDTILAVDGNRTTNLTTLANALQADSGGIANLRLIDVNTGGIEDPVPLQVP